MAAEEFPFLVGRTVDQIWVWGTIRLVFELDDRSPTDMYVDVNDPVYVSPDGTTSIIDVVGSPDEAGRLFRLFKQQVSRASAENGVLSLSFEDGAELRAHPDDQYENWSVIGDGRTYQCLPGGEIGSW